MSSRSARNLVLLAGLLSLVMAAPAALADDVCKEYTKKNQRIERLGGPQAFSKTPVKSPGELVQQLKDHREELSAILRDKGLGQLTDQLIAAAGDSRSLSERNLVPGEVFEWMAWRKRGGQATATGPVCFAAKKEYSAYEILVRDEESTTANAKCSLKASGQWDGEPIKVDASGSSPGVEVTMSGPGGTKTIISGDKTSWEGMPSGPGTYTFTARASAQGSKKTTTYKFVVPKICVNLAYQGMTKSDGYGATDTCTDTATVEIVRREPECKISAPPEAYRKQTFTIDVTGSNYDSVMVKIKDAATGQYVDAYDDSKNTYTDLTSFPVSVYIKRAGDYVIEGEVKNDYASATCSTPITITRPPISAWTLRGFLFTIDSDSDKIMTSMLRPDGVSERTKLGLEGGAGLGAGLEYHLNDRIGLEGGLMWANLDSSFILDLNDQWELDEESSTFTAFTFGPNFHLSPNSKLDFYVGLFLGWADLGDATYSVLGERHSRDFGDSFVLGGQLGLDIPFGAGDWGLHLGLRYLSDLEVEFSEDGDDLEVGPLFGEIGFFKNF